MRRGAHFRTNYSMRNHPMGQEMSSWPIARVSALHGNSARLLLSVFRATTLSSDQLASQSARCAHKSKKSGCLHPKVASLENKFFLPLCAARHNNIPRKCSPSPHAHYIVVILVAKLLPFNTTRNNSARRNSSR